MVFSWLWYSIINVTLLLMEMISTQVHLKCSLAYRNAHFLYVLNTLRIVLPLLKNLLKHILLQSQMIYNYSGVQLQYHVVT
jgi:hypothetical protein